MELKIEIEQEVDGRWIAEVMQLPGVFAYGDSVETAVAKVQVLARRVLVDRLEHEEISLIGRGECQGR
jgi:predicted RNase H-like HicB family nuclease